MPTEEEIQKLAYGLWEQEGRPDGKDWDHYFKARQMLEEQEAAKARAPKARPVPSTRTQPGRMTLSPKKETKR